MSTPASPYYDMTQPCRDCPFRREGGIRLRSARVCEITAMQGEFPCHATVDYGDDRGVETERSRHCAGFLIFREKIEQPSQMMRIAERLGLYDHTGLCGHDDVFDDLDEMLAVNKVEQRGRDDKSR